MCVMCMVCVCVVCSLCGLCAEFRHVWPVEVRELNKLSLVISAMLCNPV